MSTLNLQNIRQSEGLFDALRPIRVKIEERINLQNYSENQKPVSLDGNKIMRICLLAELSNKETRELTAIVQIQ